jgi:hypothetical protein
MTKVNLELVEKALKKNFKLLTTELKKLEESETTIKMTNEWSTVMTEIKDFIWEKINAYSTRNGKTADTRATDVSEDTKSSKS